MGFEALKREWTEHVLAVASDRFERRLAVELAEFRVEIGKEFADTRREMSDLRVELLRWSFICWLGQISVIVAMLAYMLRVLDR